MRNTLSVKFLAGLFVAGSALPALAGAGDPTHPDILAQKLHERGYHHIQIDEAYGPGAQAYACKGNTHFRIEFDSGWSNRGRRSGWRLLCQ